MHEIDKTLKKIVSNLCFEWNDDVHTLFRKINPFIWSLFRRNLYRFMMLQSENPLLYRRHLATLLAQSEFHELYQKVVRDNDTYLKATETPVTRDYPEMKDKLVAYFSMEYGIDILRIYSGGLGILSGDHLRGASDLGVPMTGVGLLYQHGYYEQQVDLEGTMKVLYEALIPANKPPKDFVPLEALKRAGSNEELFVNVPIGDREVKTRVWRVKIGRTDLLLLDTSLPENPVHDRHTTRRLYASQKQHEEERRRRFEQELVLGIGGVRALIESGYKPAAYHLNEGHVAFASLEVIRNLMKNHSMPFDEAREHAARQIGFTTHTPVPEGNERFDERLAREYLTPYLDSFLKPADRETIFNCARNREDMFDMTKLSLLLSGACRNGVSALHGEVCRKMWGWAWGILDPAAVPITSITNSVHVPYWQKPSLRKLLTENGGHSAVHSIPDETIWTLHVEYKAKLIEKARERYAYQLLRDKVDAAEIHARTQNLLSADAFFIGFARRFADYKRVTMMLDDEERLFKFLENTYRKYGRPVHIVYAGKPHPNNYPGRGRIKQIVQLSDRLAQRCKDRGFRSQLLFIQGYDIDLARYLVAGVDIWLNNPIRPLEASGTSGMKAGMNGVLNVSISDGWVPEGIETGKNGWMFGKGEVHATESDRDELFHLLENQILPAYFDTQRAPEGTVVKWPEGFKPEEGFTLSVSRRWVEMMKNSISTITEKFNTDRMLREYVEKIYLPAVRASHQTLLHKASV